MQLRALAIALILSGAAGKRAAAQAPPAPRDTTAAIVGSVYSAYSGRPLVGVLVSLPQSPAFTSTDSSGRFELRGVQPGGQMLRLVYRDRLEASQLVTLRPGRTSRLTVVLNVDAIAMPAIEITATGSSSRYDLTGFYERRKVGFGRFYTFEQLDRLGAAALRNLLSEAGLNVTCSVRMCGVFEYRAGRQCAVPLFVDGWEWPIEEANRIRADQLAAVEIYRRGTGVPMEFRRTMEDCGAIVVWTRWQ